jgi:hypothetical protein
LDNTDSLIANYIYQDFLTKQILDFQQQEQKKLILKMQPIKHQHLIAAASQNFIKQYQGNLQEPFIYGNFIDYYGCNEKKAFMVI